MPKSPEALLTSRQLLANMYDAMGRVHTSMQSELSAIGEIFQEKPPKDPDVALMLEIVSLVFAVAGAPIWNSVLRKTGYFALNPNTLGVLKDGVNGAVANGLTIAKGRLAKEATLESGSALGISLSDAVNSYYESISDLVRAPLQLFVVPFPSSHMLTRGSRYSKPLSLAEPRKQLPSCGIL